jgi:hypothetical protein
VALKACTVVVHDLNDIAHAIDVTAESLYEAIAQALATLRGHDWVGDIGKGLTTVTVKVGHPEITHVVKIQDFENWLKCSKARSHSSGCESHRQNRPGTVVVISSGEKGNQLAGSLEVKASVAGITPGQIRTGGERLDRLQQKRTRKPRKFWPARSGLQGTWECRASSCRTGSALRA